jgi:hypothetical protein
LIKGKYLTAPTFVVLTCQQTTAIFGKGKKVRVLLNPVFLRFTATRTSTRPHQTPPPFSAASTPRTTSASPAAAPPSLLLYPATSSPSFPVLSIRSERRVAAAELVCPPAVRFRGCVTNRRYGGSGRKAQGLRDQEGGRGRDPYAQEQRGVLQSRSGFAASCFCVNFFRSAAVSVTYLS